MRFVVAGGGTAGHVFPGLALARALSGRGHEVSFVGTARGLEARLVPEAGFEFSAVPAQPLVRSVSMGALRAPFVAFRSIQLCRPVVHGCHAVIGMGGYVSVSTVLAARRERVPAVIHEQNAVPGLANRVLSRVSKAVALSFPDARAGFPRRTRTRLTGNPVREEILGVRANRAALAKESIEELNLEEGRRTVVMFGGSQGALAIDRAALGACRLLARRKDLQVVLITGAAHLDEIRRAAPSTGNGLLVRIIGYLERMELAYAVADLVVARAGATTVSELSVCGVPALLVPYPHATRKHQEANARSMQRAGGASVLLDDQLSPDTLRSRLEALIDHDERLRAMAARSEEFGRPDAAARMADLVEEVGEAR